MNNQLNWNNVSASNVYRPINPYSTGLDQISKALQYDMEQKRQNETAALNQRKVAMEQERLALAQQKWQAEQKQQQRALQEKQQQADWTKELNSRMGTASGATLDAVNDSMLNNMTDNHLKKAAESEAELDVIYDNARIDPASGEHILNSDQKKRVNELNNRLQKIYSGYQNITDQARTKDIQQGYDPNDVNRIAVDMGKRDEFANNKTVQDKAVEAGMNVTIQDQKVKDKLDANKAALSKRIQGLQKTKWELMGKNNSKGPTKSAGSKNIGSISAVFHKYAGPASGLIDKWTPGQFKSISIAAKNKGLGSKDIENIMNGSNNALIGKNYSYKDVKAYIDALPAKTYNGSSSKNEAVAEINSEIAKLQTQYNNKPDSDDYGKVDKSILNMLDKYETSTDKKTIVKPKKQKTDPVEQVVTNKTVKTTPTVSAEAIKKKLTALKKDEIREIKELRKTPEGVKKIKGTAVKFEKEKKALEAKLKQSKKVKFKFNGISSTYGNTKSGIDRVTSNSPLEIKQTVDQLADKYKLDKSKLNKLTEIGNYDKLNTIISRINKGESAKFVLNNELQQVLDAQQKKRSNYIKSGVIPYNR